MAMDLEEMLAQAPWQDANLAAQNDRSVLEQDREICRDLGRMQAALKIIPDDSDFERNVRREAEEALRHDEGSARDLLRSRRLRDNLNRLSRDMDNGHRIWSTAAMVNEGRVEDEVDRDEEFSGRIAAMTCHSEETTARALCNTGYEAPG